MRMAFAGIVSRKHPHIQLHLPKMHRLKLVLYPFPPKMLLSLPTNKPSQLIRPSAAAVPTRICLISTITMSISMREVTGIILSKKVPMPNPISRQASPQANLEHYLSNPKNNK
jgi:hypothetical protein